MTVDKKNSLAEGSSVQLLVTSLLLVAITASSIGLQRVYSIRTSGNTSIAHSSGGGGDFGSSGGGADFTGNNSTSSGNLDIEKSRESTDSLLIYLPAINEQTDRDSTFIPVETASFFSGVVAAIFIGLLRHRIDRGIHSQYEKANQDQRRHLRKNLWF